MRRNIKLENLKPNQQKRLKRLHTKPLTKCRNPETGYASLNIHPLNHVFIIAIIPPYAPVIRPLI